jgi:hypothetical protein
MAAPNRQPAHDVAVLRTNAFVASRLVPAAGGDHDDIAARSLRERWLHLAITFADRVFGPRLARERYPLNVCIESETRVAGAMSRVSRRGRHLGSGSAKLVSAPTLHRALRSWRELYVSAGNADASGRCAVRHVPAVRGHRSTARDARHDHVAVLHVCAVRVRMAGPFDVHVPHPAARGALTARFAVASAARDSWWSQGCAPWMF